MTQHNLKTPLDFDVYWNRKRRTFNKPADAVALFFHWCMIRKNFKCVDKVKYLLSFNQKK